NPGVRPGGRPVRRPRGLRVAVGILPGTGVAVSGRAGYPCRTVVPMGGVIIPFGIIHMLYRVVVPGHIAHVNSTVSPFVETVEIIGRTKIPAKRTGYHHTGVAVISSVPVRKLKADGPVERHYIQPDLVL